MVDERNAEQTVKNYLVGKDIINKYPLYRYSDIDINGFLGFSLFPGETGKAGEILLLAGDNIVIRGGNDNDFKSLMARLLTADIKISLEKFALLYSRLFLLRRSVLLTRDTEIPFGGKESFFADKYSEPVFKQDAQGITYSCWLLDTESFEPFHINGAISLKGEIKS
jgi:hypothetical protein